MPIEVHPWEPYAPTNARMLILGTFPPPEKRWRMDFYYPNPTNDFWRMMGIIFYDNRSALYDSVHKKFHLEKIKELLNREGIAVGDTARAVRRLRGNASDKFLEIVAPIDLAAVLATMPECDTVVTTGEKAAGVVAMLTETEVPKTGTFVETLYKPLGRRLKIWRMPSTSRAYPLAVEIKAEAYRQLFE